MRVIAKTRKQSTLDAREFSHNITVERGDQKHRRKFAVKVSELFKE